MVEFDARGFPVGGIFVVVDKAVGSDLTVECVFRKNSADEVELVSHHQWRVSVDLKKGEYGWK